MATNKQSRRRAAASQGEPDGLDLGSDKLYFKIGEVAEIVGVAAHVLRYWENEFSALRPQKSRTQQRVYRRKDVATLLRIKHLLYEKRFTIAGARVELKDTKGVVELARPSAGYLARQSLNQAFSLLEELRGFVAAQDAPAPAAADPSGFLIRRGGVAALIHSEAERRATPAERQASGPVE